MLMTALLRPTVCARGVVDAYNPSAVFRRFFFPLIIYFFMALEYSATAALVSAAASAASLAI